MISLIHTASLRVKLLIALGLVLAGGLIASAIFVGGLKTEVRRIIDSEMVKMASYMAKLIEDEAESLKIQATQLGRENALRVVLDLELPAQANKIISDHAESSSFKWLWLLNARGEIMAASDESRKILLPPVKLHKYEAFIKWNGQLSAVFVVPILQHADSIGYLVAMTRFPDAEFFARLDDTENVGLALWMEGSPVGMSPWLWKTDYQWQQLPETRNRLTIGVGKKVQDFVTTPIPFTTLNQSIGLRGELLRSLNKAQQPFELLTVLFYVSTAFSIVCLGLFTQYISQHLILPIQRLSRHADSIRRKGYTTDVSNPTCGKSAAQEVETLYTSFYEMVNSLNESRIKAEQAERIKADFLSVVSHELRTPMTSILGFTKMNRKRLKDGVYKHLDVNRSDVSKAISLIENNFDIIVSEGNRLTDLINDVLNLAKLESGSFEWNMKPVDVEEILRQSLAACTSLFIAKDLDYQISVADNIPPILGDYAKLMQVVVNLLSNSIKFTDKGIIICRAWRTEDSVIVSIADQGIGIPNEEQDLVFQRFHQRRETLTDKPQGTGLGLPICKNIIDAHGGSIWFKSKLGAGSTFFFSLPVNRAITPQAK